MKIFSNISLIIFLGLSVSLNAQVRSNKDQASNESSPVKSNDVKANFIKNQDYLSTSPSTIKDHKALFGDSLNGFDEATVKANLLSRFLVGSEVFGALNNIKREYINNKYKIGPRFVIPPPSQTASRPGSGGNSVNIFPCVNEDFELTTPGAYSAGNAVAGWTIDSGTNSGSGAACGYSPGWTPGSPEFSIVATPILGVPYVNGNNFSINNVSIPNSPLGGNNVARLNDSQPGFLMTRLRATFPVTSANTLFQFAYAGSWDGSGHACCDQPAFNIRMFNCPGAPLTCASVSLTAGTGCGSQNSYSTSGSPLAVSWTNWVVNYIDLTPFIGSCITIEVLNNDCDGGAHHGTAYFDARCGGALVGLGLSGVGGSTGGAVSFCAGSNQATIQAPLGYSTYQWYGPNPGNPPIAMSPTLGGNTNILTIPGPVSGAVYTVGLVTAAGCSYTAVDTLNFSQVSIIGIGTTSSCPGGASGSATVQGNGSGTGYSYTWTPVNSTVAISSASTVGGLLPGTYSVNLTGFGAAGCGSAATTVTIGVSPPNYYSILKPFCGSEAYLSASGSQFQWYDPGAIPGPIGTASGYTVNAPYNGQIVFLTYYTTQGCRDSVKFILSQTPSGSMYVNNISYACPGVGNATANVVLIPASGSPPGVNSFSVWSTNSTPPYASSIFPTAINGYTPTAMPAGTYSVSGFDGSCKYNTTFVVQNYLYNYTVGPVTSTLCPNNSIIAGVTFSTTIALNQYSFNWSPSTYIVGGALNTSNISVQIAPVIPSGSIITTIYTVTVRPTIVNCPITKTISVTAVNLQIPTITSPQPFCTNASAKTITVSQSGGVFSTGIAGNWLNANTGVITPSNLANSVGTNTFMYTVSVSTCVVSNSGSIDVSKFNSAALSGTVTNQCVTNPCINLMNIVTSQVNGTWSGPGVNANIFCPNSFTASSVVTLNYNTTSTPNPGLCPDSKTLSVSVSETVTPAITSFSAFCTNKPSFSMIVSPSGGSWSSPVPLFVSPGGVVNPAAPGLPLGNTVLTYVVNTGACVNTGTTVLNATQFRSAALSGSIANMCSNSSPVYLMNIVQNPGNAGTWSGCGIQLGTNFFSPQQALQAAASSPLCQSTPPGYFTLTYQTTSVPNPTVCPDTRKLVVFVLDPATPTISPLVQTIPHCNVDAPFQIMVTPNTGSFTPTTYLTSDGIFTPSLCPVGNNMIQYTIGTSTCNVQDTKMITVEAFVPSTITGAVPDQCNTNQAIDLSSITLSNTGTWVGPGMVGSSFNPAISGSGKIVLTYKTSSFPSGLCPAQSTLGVNVFSVAVPSIDDQGPYCNSHVGTIQLRVTPLGGLFSGENNRAVDVLGRFSPASARIGDNIINYSITAGPCVAYAQTVIKIEKFISADFAKYAGPFCRNETPFDLNSIAQNPGGDFANFVGSGVDNGTGMFVPSNANIGNTNIIFYKTHSMPTASLCPDTSYMRILVNDVPHVSIASNVNKGCSPVEVVFNSPDAVGGKGEWTVGDGSTPIKGLTVSHTYTSSGTYSVVFNYWDEIGCTGQATLTTPVTVYANPVAAFSYGPYGDDLTISDPEVQFTNSSTVLGNNTYQWQIADMYSLTDVNPKVTFPKIGKYEITLTATSIYGCKDIASQTVEIKNDFGVYIPNSFTPNDDDLNDVFIPVFTPYGLDAKTFDMEIFDRWGTSLYHTKDVTRGWNGSLQNKGTESLKQEVYVYKIKYKDVNGVIYNKLGYVTLLR